MHFALATLWSLDHTTFLCTDRHLYFGLWLPMAPCLPLSPSISRLWKTSQHIFVHHNSLVRHVLSDHSEVQHKIPGKDTFEHETTLFRPHCLKKHSSQSGGGEGKHFTAHQALRRLFHCVPQACEVCGTRFRCNTREPFLVGEDGDAGVAEGLRYYWRCYGRCSLRNCWIGRALTPAPQLSAAGGCVALRASGPGCSSCGTRGCPFRPTAQLCRWDPCMHANGRSDVHLDYLPWDPYSVGEMAPR